MADAEVTIGGRRVTPGLTFAYDDGLLGLDSGGSLESPTSLQSPIEEVTITGVRDEPVWQPIAEPMPEPIERIELGGDLGAANEADEEVTVEGLRPEDVEISFEDGTKRVIALDFPITGGALPQPSYIPPRRSPRRSPVKTPPARRARPTKKPPSRGPNTMPRTAPGDPLRRPAPYSPSVLKFAARLLLPIVRTLFPLGGLLYAPRQPGRPGELRPGDEPLFAPIVPDRRPDVPVRAPGLGVSPDDLPSVTVSAPRNNPFGGFSFAAPNLGPDPFADPFIGPLGNPEPQPIAQPRVQPRLDLAPDAAPELDPLTPGDPFFEPITTTPLPFAPTAPPRPDIPTFLSPVPDLGPVPKEELDRCGCPKPKKRKKREPRTECRKGTYQQTSRGVIYHPKELIPCQ